MGQDRRANHGSVSKKEALIPVRCLRPFTPQQVAFHICALYVKKVDCPFLERAGSPDGNPTYHHSPPLPGTELVVSRSQEQGDSQCQPAPTTRPP